MALYHIAGFLLVYSVKSTIFNATYKIIKKAVGVLTDKFINVIVDSTIAKLNKQTQMAS